MESWYLSPSEQTVSIDKKTGFAQSKCAHKTIQKPSLDSPIFGHAEHGSDVGETMWAEPHISRGLLKAGVHEGRPVLQPGGSQTCKRDLKPKPRQLNDNLHGWDPVC